MNWLLWSYGAIFGSILGSFLNAAIPRRHELRTLLTTRSYCPICRTQIKGYDNIPIVSWFALRGRCRACGAPIPISYTYREIGLAALGSFIAGVMFGVPPIGLVVGLAGWAALALIGSSVARRAAAA